MLYRAHEIARGDVIDFKGGRYRVIRNDWNVNVAPGFRFLTLHHVNGGLFQFCVDKDAEIDVFRRCVNDSDWWED